MHTSCNPTSVIFPLSYALLTLTAFLSATISTGNETILGLPVLPVLNVSGIPPATGVAPIPVSSRSIVLDFIAHGKPIPENEVKNTLDNADQAIADLAHDRPTERITNDRFEYRRPNGNMLISIRTNFGEEITWMELFRILGALSRYMTSGMAGTKETHYEALEFEIEAIGQEKPNIGLGLVWYFPPTETQVQERAAIPLPISLINQGTLGLPNLTFPQPSNETLRLLPNTSLALLGANNMEENINFRIPKTSLSLSFFYFGPSIPDRSVKATLQGATAKVRPYLNSPFEMEPIENDSFRWVLPLSREAGVPVAVTVFTYPPHEITWRQLFDILFGLYAFTTTFGTDLAEPHYQVLGFRVVDVYLRNLGVGTISYYRSGAGQVAKRVESFDKRILPEPLSAPNISSVNPVAVSRSIVYQVPNTDITLTFTFLGETPVPLLEIVGALSGAQQKISHSVVQDPNGFIHGYFKDFSVSGRVSTNIWAYPGKFIMWRELDYILSGILHFCQDDQDHDRVLVFEIDTEAASRGRVGFGTLLFIKSDSIDVEERVLVANDTTLQLPTNIIVSQPSLTALALPIPYPIPGTPITLMFDTFRSPIPSIYVNGAFTSALRTIQVQVAHHPNTPIPNDRWERRGAVTKVWITVVAYNGNKISWHELSSVLAAVLRFMTEAGEDRCREVGYFIDKLGGEETGYGSVTYVPDDDVFEETGK
ncbi:MAG: hypothetical protein ASARMPREDX12_005528 [Alectoria sarmentosa]|nr:MAG: hypothetical protein ASARMPREDX12_005528 [Alectoria sarmentosa]